MFKTLILQRLYNLSDDQTEYMIRDRASFQRFLGLHVGDGSPDAKTIWKFREQLTVLNLSRDLFIRFELLLCERGFEAKGGQIVDATIVEVPRQRNTREENAQIKAGEIPPQWESQPNKLAQKDLDACWTKKRGQTYYGYKNHINVDQEHKLIRDHTHTAVDRSVYADSAYRSEAREEMLRKIGVESRIHERAYAGTALTEAQKASNTEKSRVRARVEHTFGFMTTNMNGATFIRCIGSLRAQAIMILSNLTYNMSRFLQITKAPG